MKDKFNMNITPLNFDGELVRIGNPEGDGGYIIPAALLKVDSLYTYGVGTDFSFENDFAARTKKPVRLYDFSIDAPVLPQGMTFAKAGLSAFKSANTDNVINHLAANGDKDKQILLKIDIEGNEYEWITYTDIKELSNNVAGIVIEFHAVNEALFAPALARLQSHFNVVWVHGNNLGGVFNRGDYYHIPRVIEVTLVRKDFLTFKELSTNSCPISLDRPNAYYLPDIVIDFYKFNNSIIKH